MLTPAVEKANTNSDKPSGPAPPAGYGMGWSVRQQRAGLVAGRSYPLVFSHSGGAVGASSVLIVLPRDLAHEGSRKVCQSSKPHLSKPSINRTPKLTICVAFVVRIK